MKKSRSKNIRIDIIMTIFLFGIHALIAFVVTPIYSVLAADVLQSASLAADTARTVIDVLDTCAMSGGFAFLSIAIFMKMNRFKFFSLYALAVLFRRICALLTTFILNRVIGLEDIIISVSVFAVDIIILLIAFCIILIIFNSFQKKQSLEQNTSALFGEKEEEVNRDFSSLYPFTKILTFKNSLQTSIFATSVLLSVIKIVLRTLSLAVEVPDSIMMTVCGYFCDLLICPIAYAFACFLLPVLYSSNEKRNRKDL